MCNIVQGMVGEKPGVIKAVPLPAMILKCRHLSSEAPVPIFILRKFYLDETVRSFVRKLAISE